MKKYAPKSKNQSFMSKLSLCSSFFFLKFGFMSSLSIIFSMSKFSWITKNWVEDAVNFSVKKKKRAGFWRYEKYAPYKFFHYKFSRKHTELIFDLVKI